MDLNNSNPSNTTATSDIGVAISEGCKVKIKKFPQGLGCEAAGSKIVVKLSPNPALVHFARVKLYFARTRVESRKF